MKTLVYGSPTDVGSLLICLKNFGFDRYVITDTDDEAIDVRNKFRVYCVSKEEIFGNSSVLDNIMSADYFFAFSLDFDKNINACLMAKNFYDSRNIIVRKPDISSSFIKSILDSPLFPIDHFFDLDELIAKSIFAKIDGIRKIDNTDFPLSGLHVSVTRRFSSVFKKISEFNMYLHSTNTRVGLFRKNNENSLSTQICFSENILSRAREPLVFIGPSALRDQTFKKLKSSEEEIKEVILSGTLSAMVNFIRQVSSRAMHITILEENEAVARLISKIFPNMSVTIGSLFDDDSSQIIFDKNPEIFISLDKIDYINGIRAIRVKELFGAKTIAAIVNDNLPKSLFKSIGVDIIVSMQNIIGNLLHTYLGYKQDNAEIHNAFGEEVIETEIESIPKYLMSKFAVQKESDFQVICVKRDNKVLWAQECEAAVNNPKKGDILIFYKNASK